MNHERGAEDDLIEIIAAAVGAIVKVLLKWWFFR
jgi:hypothetical protein